MIIIVTVFVGEEIPVKNINKSGVQGDTTARSEGMFLAVSGYRPFFFTKNVH